MHKIYYLKNKELAEIMNCNMYYSSYLYINQHFLAIKEIQRIIQYKECQQRYKEYILLVNAYYQNKELHIG